MYNSQVQFLSFGVHFFINSRLRNFFLYLYSESDYIKLDTAEPRAEVVVATPCQERRGEGGCCEILPRQLSIRQGRPSRASANTIKIYPRLATARRSSGGGTNRCVQLLTKRLDRAAITCALKITTAVAQRPLRPRRIERRTNGSLNCNLPFISVYKCTATACLRCCISDTSSDQDLCRNE